MNPEIEQLIEEHLASLPSEIRKVLAETDIVNEIMSVKDKYHLMLDQVTSLELDTRLTILGIYDPEDFVRNIKSHAKLNDDIATSVANDIENSIFKKIKEALIKETADEYEILEENLDKDSILAEIENPVPTFQPKSTITPVNTEKIPENFPAIKTSQTIENYIPPSMPVKSIVERKLSEPTRIPPKEIEVSLKKLPETPAQTLPSTQKYSFDPYKEPIA